MKKITFLLIIISLFMTCCIAGCKKNDDGYKGWEITEKRVNGNADANALQYYASFRITPINGERKVSEVWVNVSNLEKDSAEFSLAFSKSSSISSPKEFSFTLEKSALETNGGWVKILSAEEEIDYNYVEVYVMDTMKFNEFVVVGENNKKLELTLNESGERPNRGASSANKYDADKLTEAIEAGKITSSALNLIDEQDKLQLNK